MERVNLTNLLVRIENVMCVYRNYSDLKTSAKCIVILRVFVESLVIIFIVVCYFYTFGDLATEVSNNSYLLFSAVNSFAAIYLSCYKSNQFKEFVFNIKAVNNLLRNNTTYQSIAKTQIRHVYIELTIFAAFLAGMAAYFFIAEMKFFENDYNFFITFEITLILILDLRFLCVNLVFYEFIKVIVAPLEHLNASVRMVVERIKTGCGEERDDEDRRELEEWGAVNQHLGIASNRLCDCFGVQITFSIFSTTLFLIILLYEGVSSIVKQRPSSTGLELGCIIYRLILLTVIKFLIVSSGQRVIRNGELLHKNLVMLHNLLVGREEASACARAAAGLARRLRAAPLRLRLLPALAVQMALLSEILTVVANYTIVLLQFNHVV